MSRETRQWLNENILRGMTENRGTAWWYTKGYDNHYPGAIPVGDVRKRLFNWEPVVVDRACPCGCEDVAREVSRSDTRHRFKTFTGSYVPHDFNEWLVGGVSNILGDTLGISSAGLLRKGAIAWVQVEAPEVLKSSQGVEFKPNILATTSLDGSVATTYKRTTTFCECDNTREIAMGEFGQEYKVKHTKYSEIKIADAREALLLLEQQADRTMEMVDNLTATHVSDKQWADFLNAYAPVPEDPQTAGEKRTASKAEHRREELTQLWTADPAAAPWKNTAYGVLAATNTWRQHYATTYKSDHRVERNFEHIIKGKMAEFDREAMALLDGVLAAA